MLDVCRLLALLDPKQQQTAVSCVDHGMNTFREHRRAPGKRRRGKFSYRDGEIAANGGINRFFGFGHGELSREPTRHAD